MGTKVSEFTSDHTTTRSRRALRAARVLLYDHTVCPGWWKVSEEASDAVRLILGQPIPVRERMLP
jgi:hypothetical protein